MVRKAEWLKAFYVLNNTLTTGSWMNDLGPELAIGKANVVRIWNGIDTEDHRGGNEPGVALFTRFGDHRGMRMGKKFHIPVGKFLDARITPPDDAKHTKWEYISVTNGGHDRFCVAAISAPIYPHVSAFWSGDMGKYCGADWYYSVPWSNKLPEGYRPVCTWIDRDRVGHSKNSGMAIHISDFEATEERRDQYWEHKETLCNSRPRFHMYAEMKTQNSIPVFAPPLEFYDNLTDINLNFIRYPNNHLSSCYPNEDYPSGEGDYSWCDGQNKKRSLESQEGPVHSGQGTFRSHLVASVLDGHSAKELCESPNSHGPDFVSHAEGQYCDMDIKQLWPLCTNETSHRVCFDHQTYAFVTNNAIQKRDSMPDESLMHTKNYTKIDHWA